MAIPKRSYWLREVVTEDGTSYHISFRDGKGKIQELCVPYDFYMAFRRLELDERKLEGWDFGNHGGNAELAGGKAAQKH